MPYPRRSNRRSKLYEKQGENPLIFPVGGDDESAHILSGVTQKDLVANCKEGFALGISTQTTVCAAVHRYYFL